MSALRLLCAALVALGLSGCSHLPLDWDSPSDAPVQIGLASGFETVTSPPFEPMGYDTQEFPKRYLLDTGDVVRVVVFGQRTLSSLYQIDTAGLISVPLIGTVKARGLTTQGLETVIRDLLAAEFVRDPKVSVEVQTYRPFFILGEVRTPGQYAYVPGITALSAVAIAGGYSERAERRKLQITRRSLDATDILQVTPATVILPGDTIVVDERFF